MSLELKYDYVTILLRNSSQAHHHLSAGEEPEEHARRCAAPYPLCRLIPLHVLCDLDPRFADSAWPVPPAFPSSSVCTCHGPSSQHWQNSPQKPPPPGSLPSPAALRSSCPILCTLSSLCPNSFTELITFSSSLKDPRFLGDSAPLGKSDSSICFFFFFSISSFKHSVYT